MSLNITDDELKIILLYAVKTSGGIVSPEILWDILADSDINYMQVKMCYSELEEAGRFIVRNDDGELYVGLTKESEEALEELKHKIPVSTREKIAASTSKEIARIRKNIAVQHKITENGYSKDFTLELILKDDDRVIFSTQLYSPTKMQAEIMARVFKKDPLDVYKKIISVLTDNR